MRNSWNAPATFVKAGTCVRDNYQVGIGFQQDEKYVYSCEQIARSQDMIARRIAELGGVSNPETQGGEQREKFSVK